MSGETGQRTPSEKLGKPLAAVLAGTGRKAQAVLGFLLGIDFGKRQEPEAGAADKSTRLAAQRTDLALERSYLAAERTLMAWIRTALAMISFGFTLGKLGEVLEDVEVKGVLGHVRNISVESIAFFLVILGTLALLGAAVQHRVRVYELVRMGLCRQFSITFVVALLLVVVGGFAFTALVINL